MFFGGMFLGFAVYRHRYTEAFSEAAQHMSVLHGCINTAVLLCSSFTVVLAVHNAHLGNQKGLVRSLILTLILGCAFLCIKGHEYYKEYTENLIPGLNFVYGNDPQRMPVPGERAHSAGIETTATAAPIHGDAGHGETTPSGGHDHEADHGAGETGHHAPRTPAYANQAKIFMSFYFMMTGVHATHMLVGVGLFIWLLIEARRGKYSAEYFVPVENVGLYWHFVDIIWIFVFPILYLLHY
jgi:cytochrome c oxidase subunit 3